MNGEAKGLFGAPSFLANHYIREIFRDIVGGDIMMKVLIGVAILTGVALTIWCIKDIV